MDDEFVPEMILWTFFMVIGIILACYGNSYANFCFGVATGIPLWNITLRFLRA